MTSPISDEYGYRPASNLHTLNLEEYVAALEAECVRLRSALEKIAAMDIAWPEGRPEYPSFALMTARAALTREAGR